MQTTFSPAQLKDPAIQRSNEVLRTCVHCGYYGKSEVINVLSKELKKQEKQKKKSYKPVLPRNKYNSPQANWLGFFITKPTG